MKKYKGNNSAFVQRLHTIADILFFFFCFRANSLAYPAVEFDFFMEFCNMLEMSDGLMKYDITKSGTLLSLLHEMLLSHDVYQVMEYS